MNFINLVESGKYRKKDLSQNGQALINGMEYALDCIHSKFNNVDEPKDEKVINELVREIQNNIVEKIETYLYAEICSAIVTLVDEENTKKENEENV